LAACSVSRFGAAAPAQLGELSTPIFFRLSLNGWRRGILDLHPTIGAAGAIGRAKALRLGLALSTARIWSMGARSLRAGHERKRNEFIGRLLVPIKKNVLHGSIVALMNSDYDKVFVDMPPKARTR